MATYFESLLLCICSIHFGKDSTFLDFKGTVSEDMYILILIGDNWLQSSTLDRLHWGEGRFIS